MVDSTVILAKGRKAMLRDSCSRVLVLLAVTLAAVGCQAAGPAATAQPTHVVAMLDWFPNTNHTGLYVALEKGWYRDQGLDVEIVEPAEGSTLVQVVAAGQADFGISYQEEVSEARAEDVPVVSIAAIIQHNTSGFASPKDRNITRPKDFEGKRYGSWGSPIERAVLDVLMSCDGGDVNKVQFIDIGSADYFTVIQRDVDFAWVFYGWTGIEAELRGTPLDIVMLSDWSDCVPDYYTPVIITSEQTVAEKPDLVRRFMAATAQGYEFAISNPAEAAEILLKYAPESNADLVRRSQEWLSPRYQADAPRWGEQKLEIWQGYADWMADRGVLPRHIDAKDAFTNEFLP
jgi:ABC-type nitrate/sulfonate/bicarbonate transport system substrate-binding protein